MSPLPNATEDGKKAQPASDEAALAAVAENDALTAKASGENLRLDIPQNPSHRVASPTLSVFSLEDYPSAHTATSSTFLLSQSFHQHGLPNSSEKRPQTWMGRLHALWSHNKGLILVLVSQFFGVGMNVTTRILEIEGNHGKGYHPFQVSKLSFPNV